MEIYRTRIDTIRNYNLDPNEVINGLNGYYESDKRNGYIIVKRNDFEGPAYFTAALYLSALIEWLREDHDIFYRPGLIFDQIEAARSAAKMCGLRAHIKDEISKRGLWCGADEDVPELVDTLFKVIDECRECADNNRKDAVKLSKEIRCVVNEKESAIEKLKDRIEELEYNFKAVCDEDDIFRTRALKAEEEVKKLKSSVFDMESMHKGVLIDTAVEKKIIDSAAAEEFRNLIFTDIVRTICQECYDRGLAMNSYNVETCIMRKEIKDLKLKLKNAEESDINALIRDYCTKNDIVAPSRYFSDKACVEYLFSVVDLKQKDRSFTILQDLHRDIFKKQPDGLSAEDIANKILDRVLETEDLLHKSVDSVNKECKATGKLMVEDYKLKLKNYILKDIKEHGYRYDGLQTKSLEEIVDWIITMATVDRANIALRDIYTTVASPAERHRYNIDDCNGENIDHMKDYILKRFEGLRINTEYCLIKMAELDGRQKDLKILEEQQEFLVKQNSELNTKVSAKDDEISRLKDLINAMNEEVGDM